MIDPLLGPFDHRLDPPREVEPMKCDACDKGKIGCVPACIQPSPDCGYEAYDEWQKWEPVCLSEHTCLICKGEGVLTPSPEDWKDTKADYDFDRYMERD